MSREKEAAGSIIGALSGAALGLIKGGSMGVLIAGTGFGIPIALTVGTIGLIVGNKIGSELDRLDLPKEKTPDQIESSKYKFPVALQFGIAIVIVVVYLIIQLVLTKIYLNKDTNQPNENIDKNDSEPVIVKKEELK